MNDDEKVPLWQVLEDMHDPNGGPIAWAARRYYYENYAPPKEQKRMDLQDKLELIGAIVLWILLLAGTVFCCIWSARYR